MNTPRKTSTASQVIESLRIDAICDRFEEACRGGAGPRVEDFLAEVPLAQRPALLQQLLLVQREYGFSNSTQKNAALPPGAIPERFGRFLVFGRIGSGGFGDVYQAFDARSSRSVAIKVPRAEEPLPGSIAPDSVSIMHDPTRSNDPSETAQDQIDRLLHEASICADLQHSGVVPLQEIGCEQGTPYLVFEYIPGSTLGEWTKEQRPAPTAAATMAARLAVVLEYIHSQGIVHRDLKPGNVLVDGDGRPHVIDFGLARRIADCDDRFEGQVLGTPAYMAPEQASGAAHFAGAAADVYSLGAMLYEMLTGRPPFDDSPLIIHRVLNEPPPNPRSLDGAIPRKLEDVVLRCLEKNPSRRYATAGELAQSLNDVIDQDTVRQFFWPERKPAANPRSAESKQQFFPRLPAAHLPWNLLRCGPQARDFRRP